MKKFFYLAIALCMGFAVTSCDDDEMENTAKITFEASKWEALIDTLQYNGPLLYGENAKNYRWADPFTTLSGGLTLAWGGAYGFAEGGSAISNYIDSDIENHATFNYQLAVPQSNGSKNFVVVYCDATLKFFDGKKRVIRSMDLSPTTYQLGVTLNGDGYAASLAESGNLTITVTADNGNTMDIDLARDGRVLRGWTTIDMSRLGAVESLTFTMDGSDQSAYGVKQPKYFALDNFVVEI